MKKNLQKERIDLILELVRKKSYIKYSDLEKEINISSATIRRDVDKMVSMGLINKISGGIELQDDKFDIDYSIRSSKNLSEKKKIAKKASKYLQANELIYLDAGTTIFELIPYLKNLNITVVTNGIIHIESLLKNNISFILIGGMFKDNTKALVGDFTLKQLESFNFDKCFMGANGVDEKFGYTTPDLKEGLVKNFVISRSKQAYILADKTKLSKVTGIKFANFKDCTLITED